MGRIYDVVSIDSGGVSGGGIEEAPIDGTPYMRQDEGWVSPTASDGGTDGLDNAWTDIDTIMGSGGWGNTSFKCARKNGVVTLMSDGVFASAINTAVFAILPAWAHPEIQISAPAIAASVGISTTVSISVNGNVNIPYIGSVPNNTEIIFTVSYIGAPPPATII